MGSSSLSHGLGKFAASAAKKESMRLYINQVPNAELTERLPEERGTGQILSARE